MSNSTGSSRPVKTFKNFNSKNQIQQNNTLKTAHVLSSHSYQIAIRELIIMLPLRGQNTAVL